MKGISVVHNDYLHNYLAEWRSNLVKGRFQNSPSLTFKNWLFEKVKIQMRDEFKYSLKAYSSKLMNDLSYFRDNSILVVLQINFGYNSKLIGSAVKHFSWLNLFGIELFSVRGKLKEDKWVINILKTSKRCK